ncbi:MAG: sigma-54-dependent transcriptional regulator [bacterium]
MKTVLVVDDDERLRKQVYWALKDSYRVLQAEDRPQAHQVMEEALVDLILLDLRLPPRVNTPEEGMKTLEEIRRAKPEIEIIVITADKKEETCLRAIENGAYDYFSKPFDLEEMRVVLKRALLRQNLERKIQRLRLQLKERYNFAGMVGKSEPMRQIFGVIRILAQADCTVLLRGESGTGKELVARAIHYSSQRAENPFVPVNCAAIPESLLESELFGYEKGAFTGATTRKLGKFELASGGTIFLDEIADMSLAMQAKILRVIQERTFGRLGGTRPIKVDVRIIAATNKVLEELMRKKAFREDLYYRLNVVSIYLPALRERKKDIPLLVSHFLRKYNRVDDKNAKGISRQALKLLMDYDWPGNVRELENVIERAIVLGQGDMFLPSDLSLKAGEKPLKSGVTSSSVDISLAEAEKRLIEDTLKLTHWNQTKAAKILRIHRNTLRRKMRRLKIY